MMYSRIAALSLALALAAAAHAAADGPARPVDGFARPEEYPTIHWYPDGEYIPGYGMQDPDYIYAHTDTVSVTLVGHHWRAVRADLPAMAERRETVAVSFAPELAARVDGFAGLSAPVVEWTPGIEPVDTVAVLLAAFRPRLDEPVAAHRRHAIERADFQLWRKPRGVFMPRWERIGNAYRLADRAESHRILVGF